MKLKRKKHMTHAKGHFFRDKHTTITLTQEARDAYDNLPPYIVKWKFLHAFDFIPEDKNAVAVKVKELENMTHATRARSIALQILCTSFTAHTNNFEGRYHREA